MPVEGYCYGKAARAGHGVISDDTVTETSRGAPQTHCLGSSFGWRIHPYVVPSDKDRAVVSLDKLIHPRRARGLACSSATYFRIRIRAVEVGPAIDQYRLSEHTGSCDHPVIGDFKRIADNVAERICRHDGHIIRVGTDRLQCESDPSATDRVHSPEHIVIYPDRETCGILCDDSVGSCTDVIPLNHDGVVARLQIRR